MDSRGLFAMPAVEDVDRTDFTLAAAAGEQPLLPRVRGTVWILVPVESRHLTDLLKCAMCHMGLLTKKYGVRSFRSGHVFESLQRFAEKGLRTGVATHINKTARWSTRSRGGGAVQGACGHGTGQCLGSMGSERRKCRQAAGKPHRLQRGFEERRSRRRAADKAY